MIFTLFHIVFAPSFPCSLFIKWPCFYLGGRGRGRGAYGMGMPGAYPMYDQGMAYASMDPYGYAGYGAGSMMGYGGVPPYGGGVTYPTIDYTSWPARGTGRELNLFKYLLCFYGF